MTEKEKTLDFIQGIIDRCYLFAQEDTRKSTSYNKGILFAAFRSIDETLKVLRENEKRTISSNH